MIEIKLRDTNIIIMKLKVPFMLKDFHVVLHASFWPYRNYLEDPIPEFQIKLFLKFLISKHIMK